MNKIYKLIWSKANNAWVICSELGKKGKSTSKPLLTVLGVLSTSMSMSTFAIDYSNTTTADNTMGYQQYSDNQTFGVMTIDTSGAASDGVRLTNWGPKLLLDELYVTTRGTSADGINLERYSTDGEITVNKYAKITTEDGIGIRSVTSNLSDGAHIIRFNGSSDITTRGNGSFNSGYGVYAGVNPFGCGPFGLNIFDCQASGPAHIYLLGGTNDVHNISTQGNEAHAVYANGRGYIELKNVNISTTGRAAHGIFAQRRISDWYQDRDNSGQHDFAGSIRLIGDTKVTATGQNSYAIYADGADPANDGRDSEGKRAKVYTDISGDNSAGVYTINGNMGAINGGVVDLQMANGSSLTGATTISNGGIFNAVLNGSSSLWNMSANSSMSNLTLRDAVFRFNNKNKDPMQLNMSQMLNNAGTIDMANGVTGDKLVVENYHTAGGNILMDAFLTGNAALSTTDHITINGNATGGVGQIWIDNLNLNAATGQESLQLIDVKGSSEAKFYCNVEW